MTQRDKRGCGCRCHSHAGVKHMVACCDAPPYREEGSSTKEVERMLSRPLTLQETLDVARAIYAGMPVHVVVALVRADTEDPIRCEGGDEWQRKVKCCWVM